MKTPILIWTCRCEWRLAPRSSLLPDGRGLLPEGHNDILSTHGAGIFPLRPGKIRGAGCYPAEPRLCGVPSLAASPACVPPN